MGRQCLGLEAIQRDPTSIFLDCGRKVDYPERARACTGRTCKPHAKRIWLVFNTRFLQQRNSVAARKRRWSAEKLKMALAH